LRLHRQLVPAPRRLQPGLPGDAPGAAAAQHPDPLVPAVPAEARGGPAATAATAPAPGRPESQLRARPMSDWLPLLENRRDFGDGSAFGGVLIRGIETANGTLIDGPSLTVDYLLAKTRAADVAALDRAIAGQQAWDPANPVRLEAANPPMQHQVFRSARVGLS